MINNAFLFGTLGGLAAAAGMMAGTSLLKDHGGTSLWFGYLTLLLAMSIIFFGVKRYRDIQGGGVIKFVPALMLGIGMAVVAGVIYVAIWEVYLAATHYALMDGYVNAMIEAERAKGVTGPEFDSFVAQMNAMKVNFSDPLYLAPMLFIEIFPVGLAVALVSAAILRNSKVLPAHA